jgi:hypothetical protein
MNEYPTTLAQASVWFADQWLNGASAYHVTVTFRIEGEVGCAFIERACAKLVASTPALRARIGINGRGEVVQWFAGGGVPMIWTECPADSPDETLNKLLRDEICRPLDSDGGALARFSIIRVGNERTIIILVGHHVIMDGISQGVIADRFFQCLAGGNTEAESEDAYVELVNWVRSAEEEALARDGAYWTRRLGQDLGDTDWAIPGFSGSDGGNIRALVPPDCLRRFRELAGKMEISLFSVILGFIHRILAEQGMTRSVVCTAASVRPRMGTANQMVGCFINQIPLIAAHDSGETLAALLSRESPRWGEDLRRRFLPLPAISELLPRNGGAPIRLDRVFTSYRQPQAVRSRDCGPFRVTAEIFNRYYQAKTDLTVRFMSQADQLEYDVEWSVEARRGLGDDFAAALQFSLGAARL